MGRVSTDGINYVDCIGTGMNPIHYDNVEVQAALDSLPATGGVIYLEGALTFNKQVSRAIDNVIWRGKGLSTTLAWDASHSLITAGTQDGWEFHDFDVDAGGITVTSATNCLENYWKAGVAVGMKTLYDIDASAAEIDLLDGTYYTMLTGIKTVSLAEANAASIKAYALIPAGSYVKDIILKNTVLWTGAGTTTLDVGDGDDADGYFINVEPKDYPAVEDGGIGGVKYSAKGSWVGAFGGAVKYYAAAGTIVFNATTGSHNTTAGRTTGIVEYWAKAH